MLFEGVTVVAMPSISGFSFLRIRQRLSCFNREIVAMPSISGFSFLHYATIMHDVSIYGCNAQYLGLFISTYNGNKYGDNVYCCNAQCLGLFISTTMDNYETYVRKYVAMPSVSGFSFLRYTFTTSVKSIAFSIIFASNSQNILKSFIFLSIFGFPIFLLT